MSACVKCSRELKPGDVFCPSCGTPNPDAGTIVATADPGPTAAAPPHELQGRLQAALGGDYVVEHLIGEGGFALVFAVTDRKLQRKIALKVLRPEFTASKDSVRRFIREAESAAKLSHPHILPIFFVGEKESLVYFAIPLVDGETLDARLRREGQLPEDEVIRLGGEIADALSEAHGLGLVHRDMKPQNVMLSGARKRAMVMDFGIAKAAAGSGERLTGTGVIIGSPHYMSPEQASGDPDVDARSDIYSMGIVLWEMLAGEVPFDGPSTQGILIQHITSSVPNIRVKRPGVSAALSKVVAKATSKKKEERFQSAHELSEALKQAGMGAAGRAMTWQLPRPLALGLAAGLVVVVAGGLLAWRHYAAAAAGPHGPTPGNAARVAVLPFDAPGAAQGFDRTTVRLMTDALDKRHVPVVDDEELLGHWSADKHKVDDPLESKAAFAYEHGANQMIIGSAITAGKTLRLSVDLYDTRELNDLGSTNVLGSSDSLFGLIDRAASEIAGALCTQPGFNPQNRCFDVPARPTQPLTVTDITKPGEEQPTDPTFLVQVDSAGGVADVRSRTPSSHDDVNAAALQLVRSATFRAARKHNAPVTSWTQVTVAVRSEAESAQHTAGESACAEPGTNQQGTCYDTRPVPLASPVAPWSGAAVPSPAVLWLKVGADGKVHEVRVHTASSEADFTEAAKRAAQRMTFSPALKAGHPVTAWTQVPISKE